MCSAFSEGCAGEHNIASSAKRAPPRRTRQRAAWLAAAAGGEGAPVAEAEERSGEGVNMVQKEGRRRGLIK